MNKSDFDKRVLEFLTPEPKLDLKTLLEMVEQVMDSTVVLSEEAPANVELGDKAMQSMLLKMIPDIAVSEIGWSDVRTVEENGKTEQISGPQRKLLEDYLSNIAGSDFSEKIASVSSFYSNGAEMMKSQASDDRSKNIVQAISYLVFYKTLTKVVTNFNASSAGFSFESFLATLVNGYQIEANTGTIADYIDRASGADIPISLKLYKEGNLEVGGSYNDLVKDLAEPQFAHPLGNAMRYVICTKEFSGEGLEQTGKIKFWQFDFTLENVMDILLNSKEKSRECIRLSRKVIEALEAGVPEGSGASIMGIPEKQVTSSPEELERIFISKLQTRISTVQQENPDSLFNLIDGEAFKLLLQAIDWAKDDSLFSEHKVSIMSKGEKQVENKGVVRGKSKMPAAIVKAKSQEWIESYASEMVANNPDSPWKSIAENVKAKNNLAAVLDKQIRIANQGQRQGKAKAWKYENPMDDPQAGVIATQAASEKEIQRIKMINSMKESGELLSPEESAAAYRNLKDPEKMKYALKNSLGNLRTLHFSMNQRQATAPSIAPTQTTDNKGKPKTVKGGAGAIVVGEIQVGTSHVLRALEGVKNILNEEVGMIFQSLKVLSDSLNSYFAGGLSDDGLADLAKTNASTISVAKSLESEK